MAVPGAPTSGPGGEGAAIRGSPGRGRKEGGRRRRVGVVLDVAVACVCFALAWQAREMTQRAERPHCSASSPGDYHSLPLDVASDRTASQGGPGGGGGLLPSLLGLGGGATPEQRAHAHRARLVADIRKHAPPRVVEQCVAMVEGQQLASFAQGKQDWVLFHSFFSHMSYGEGFYVDAGANDPEHGSNSFFFDACLGWAGVCVEPNPMYAEGFRTKRTCRHLRNCLSAEEGSMVLADADKGTKGFVQAQGKGVSVVCRRLQDILEEAGVGRRERGQRRIDLVSLDIEGQEYNSLRCFPFDAFDAPVWLVETRHQNGYSLASLLGRAGYWMSPGLLVPWSPTLPSHLGAHQDNIFVRWKQPRWMAHRQPQNITFTSPEDRAASLAGLVPALVLGPDYLPGRVLEGESFLAPCNDSSLCPPTVATLDNSFELKGPGIAGGECPAFDGIRQRLSRAI